MKRVLKAAVVVAAVAAAGGAALAQSHDTGGALPSARPTGGDISTIVADLVTDVCIGPETGEAGVPAIDRRATAKGWPSLQVQDVDIGIPFEDHRMSYTDVGDQPVTLAGLRMTLTKGGPKPVSWVQCNIGVSARGDAPAVARLVAAKLGPQRVNSREPGGAAWAWRVRGDQRTAIAVEEVNIPNKVAVTAQSIAADEHILTVEVKTHEGHLLAIVNSYALAKR